MSKAWIGLLALTTVAASTALLPASAGAATSSESITVFLKAPNEAGLTALARQHGLTHAQRLAALAHLLPGATEHRTATAALTAAGFDVTGQTTWSVTATAPTATVARTFGSAHARPLGSAGAGTLPSLPDSLSGIAAAALPTSGGPQRFRPLLTSGADYRNAYTSAARTAARQSPPGGSGTGLTIATIQLTGWNPGDLQTYAADHNLPYGPGTLTEVPVDQAGVPPAPTTEDSDIEVDLDQESILSTSPHAHQRAYFAPNGGSGFLDAFSKVLDDVTQNPDAYQGGDPHIAALSVSWGDCEAGYAPTDFQLFEPILKSLVAAGVTIFASSGDAGVFDCTSGARGVDYPASSPEVLGVGGTRLVSSPGGPNNGSNWTETAWSCTDSTSCGPNGTGGSGGGASSVFPSPAYQGGSGMRTVPDIAAEGDPATGFEIYTTDPEDAPGGGTGTVGGTSLSSPVSAALFTNMLAAQGLTAGVGDIHAALYGARNTAGAFRDITSGSNGGYNAGRGYDLVTGLGAPLWPALAAVVGGPRLPQVAVSATLPSLHRASGYNTVRIAWSSSPAPAAAPAPVASVSLQVIPVGSTVPVLVKTVPVASGSLTFAGRADTTYLVTAAASQSVTNTISGLAAATVSVPIDDRGFTRKGRWVRHSCSSCVGGSYLSTTRTGSTATVRATGRSYSLSLETGRTLGKVAVWVNGRHVKTITLTARKARTEVVRIYGSSSTAVATRTIKLTEVGSRHAISLDGLLVTR